MSVKENSEQLKGGEGDFSEIDGIFVKYILTCMFFIRLSWTISCCTEDINRIHASLGEEFIGYTYAF